MGVYRGSNLSPGVFRDEAVTVPRKHPPSLRAAVRECRIAGSIIIHHVIVLQAVGGHPEEFLNVNREFIELLAPDVVAVGELLVIPVDLSVFIHNEWDEYPVLFMLTQKIEDGGLLVDIDDTIDDPKFLATGKGRLVFKNKLQVSPVLAFLVARVEIVADDPM